MRQYKNIKSNLSSKPPLIHSIYSNIRFSGSHAICWWLKEQNCSILVKLRIPRAVWRLSHISQDTNSILTLPSHIFTENIKATGRHFFSYCPPEQVCSHVGLSTWLSFFIASEQQMRWASSFLWLLHPHMIYSKHSIYFNYSFLRQLIHLT